ncbi:MAG TPA: Flp pilus assembly protein CpaB [Actinomycetota bacterium]|nr:Flp pilus assembly protein CpaB [Actinomycetota bacterium]
MTFVTAPAPAARYRRVVVVWGPFSRRWSRRSKAFAALAVVSGAAAYLVVDGYAARLETLAPVAGEPVPVVVAARDLARGTSLDDDALRVELVPVAFAPPGRIAIPSTLLGRTLTSDVAEGEPVTRTRIATSGGPIASLVPSGLRAFPIPVGPSVGAVRPGDRVDVLATFGGPRPYTDTVASGLEVLAVVEPGGATFDAAGGDRASLVLLVGPAIAEELAHASAFADLAVAVASADET